MSEISLNFMVSNQYSQDSLIVAETYLHDDCISLDKKQILSRKTIVDEKIMFKDIRKISLFKSSHNSLEYSISIEYGENIIFLKSSDTFAVKWFYDHLISKFDTFKEEFMLSKKKNFDNFLNQMDKDSTDNCRSSKNKDKFYNFCSNEER